MYSFMVRFCGLVLSYVLLLSQAAFVGLSSVFCDSCRPECDGVVLLDHEHRTCTLLFLEGCVFSQSLLLVLQSKKQHEEASIAVLNK